VRGIRVYCLALACVLGVAFSAPALGAGKSQAAKARPAAARVFRVGVLEAGPNWVHEKMLEALETAFKAKGWGDRVIFPPDARKTGAWNKGGRNQTQAYAAELMARQDLDCIIGMGTEAALALMAKNNRHTPVVAMTLSDPIASGLVKNEQDSGVDNLTTAIIPDQWLNMLRMFYSVVHFKKLGVIYTNTRPGRTYANVEDARDVAREKGVPLLEYSSLEGEATAAQCMKGLDALIAKGMDAFYVPDIPCFDWTGNDPRPLFEHLAKHKVSTFARTGVALVQLGALMGSCSFDMRPLGEFHAAQMIAIFQGRKPRELSMITKGDLGLALNLETARKIGRDFSSDVLVSSDVIVSRTLSLDSVRKWY